MVDVFFFAKGARNCSIVGATFCLGFEVSWMLLFSEGLKKGVRPIFCVELAQLEHTQAPSLRTSTENRRGKEFIVCGCSLRNHC